MDNAIGSGYRSDDICTIYLVFAVFDRYRRRAAVDHAEFHTVGQILCFQRTASWLSFPTGKIPACM